MTKDRVRSLIRKLFRSGQGRTNEAARARERVGKLVKKYGLNLRSVIDGEKRLYGVAGDYWRSVLLVNIAKSLNCQVLDQIEGRRRFAVVSGQWDDVLQTVELYRLAEVRIAVEFTAWWRGEATKPTPIQPYNGRYSIPSQWPPKPRFTPQQAKQIKPILLRFMAVSVAETFAANVPSAYSEPRAPYTPPPGKRGHWTASYNPGPYTRDSESRAGVPCEPPPPTPPAPSFGRRPHIPRAVPPPSRNGNTFDDEIQKLIAILGQDEAKVLGEGALDSGVTTATALRKIVRKPLPQLSASSEAFPKASPRIDVRARTAEHVRKVISRLGAR